MDHIKVTSTVSRASFAARSSLLEAYWRRGQKKWKPAWPNKWTTSTKKLSSSYKDVIKRFMNNGRYTGHTSQWWSSKAQISTAPLPICGLEVGFFWRLPHALFGRAWVTSWSQESKECCQSSTQTPVGKYHSLAPNGGDLHKPSQLEEYEPGSTPTKVVWVHSPGKVNHWKSCWKSLQTSKVVPSLTLKTLGFGKWSRLWSS